MYNRIVQDSSKGGDAVKWRKLFEYITTGLITAALTAVGTGCGQDENAVQQFSFEGYPIGDGAKLTYWCGLNGNLTPSTDSLGNTPYAKKLQEETGVEITYLHPAKMMETEELNLLLASGDLPDIIEYDWYHTSGGPESAISGGYIQPLNDLIEEEAPNLKAYLQEHAEIDKMVKTDEGHYYVFPFIRGDESLCVYQGLMLRGDWLNELGLDVPETIEEWTQVLRAFRDQKGANAPYVYTDTDVFAGGVGTQTGYYLEEGQIKYGPMQPEYLDYLRAMKQWYEEGLIDKNIATLSNTENMESLRNGSSGATFGWLESTMGKLNIEMQSKDPAFELIAVPFPAEEKGKIPEFGYRDAAYMSKGSAAITTACKSSRIAARFLDFSYSEAGRILNNFGIENESFTLQDGRITYTDEILHNPDGLSVGEALARYARSAYSGPFVQDKEHAELFYTLPGQQEAMQTWANNNGDQHMLPYICATADESYEIGTIDNEVELYLKEMTLKFIMGVEPLENFEAFRQGLRDCGIERALEIRQQQYQRYQQR